MLVIGLAACSGEAAAVSPPTSQVEVTKQQVCETYMDLSTPTTDSERRFEQLHALVNIARMVDDPEFFKPFDQLVDSMEDGGSNGIIQGVAAVGDICDPYL